MAVDIAKAKKREAALAARKALSMLGMAAREELMNKAAKLDDLSARSKTIGTSIPELHSLHRGVVVSIQAFGAFVRLGAGKTYKDGLVHISCVSDARIDQIGEVLEVGKTVWAKVSSSKEEEDKYSLDMRQVDQTTGLDRTARSQGIRAELPLHSELVKDIVASSCPGDICAHAGDLSSSCSADSTSVKKAKKQARKALSKLKKAQKKVKKQAKKAKKQAKKEACKSSGSSESSGSSALSSGLHEVPKDIVQHLMKHGQSAADGAFASGFRRDAGPCKTGAALDRESDFGRPAPSKMLTSDLPPDWEKKTSKSTGKTYYLNGKLGKTQWTAPSFVEARAQALVAEGEQKRKDAAQRQQKEAQVAEENKDRLRQAAASKPFWAR